MRQETTDATPAGRRDHLPPAGSGFVRHFINKNDGTYLGGDIRMDLDKLRSLGLNPDNYEEARIEK